MRGTVGVSRRLAAGVAIGVLVAGCGSGPATSTSPSANSAPTRFTVSGLVTSTPPGGIVAARVEVVAGANAGQGATTDAAGRYMLSNLLAGAMTLRASAVGYVSQTSAVTLGANQATDFALTAAQFFTRGRVIDAQTQAGLGAISVSGDGISGSSDSTGTLSVIGTAGSADPQVALFTGPTTVQRRTGVRVPGSDVTVSLIASAFDLTAFDQMFRLPLWLTRWTSPPPLTVETRTLQFVSVNAPSASAINDQMSDAEYTSLVADLSWALPQLTGGTFGGFAGVSRQTSAEGATVQLLNDATIMVTRVAGLTQATGYWGYSRWRDLSDGTVISGIVTLDRDFERSGSPFLRSVRTHELGHALGYNHVTARPSVMNSSARLEPNAFDLDACRIAFQRMPGNRTPDIDPDSRPLNILPLVATWSPPIR